MNLIPFSLISLVLTLSACTKKIPLNHLNHVSESSAPNQNDKPVLEAKTETPKAVKAPEFVRVDEDTLMVKEGQISLIRGTQVSSTQIIDASEKVLVGKDETLFVVKPAPVPEVPAVEIKKTSTEIKVDIQAPEASELMIVVSPLEDGETEKCLSLQGAESGKLLEVGHEECWSTRADIASSMKEGDSKENVTVSVDAKETIEALADYPVLAVQVRNPALPAGPETSDPEETGGAAVPISVVEAPAPDEEVVESLPVITREQTDEQIDSVLSDNSLPSDDKEQIAHLRIRSKKALKRYLENKQNHQLLLSERKELREKRKRDREVLSDKKGSERKICKKQKSERCESLGKMIRELEDKETSRTQEIAELKNEAEKVKAEALENVREVKNLQAELKNITKKAK